MKDNHIEKIRKKLITLGDEKVIEFFDNSIPNEVLPLLIEGVMSLNKEENILYFTDNILNSVPDAIIGFNDNKEIIIINENAATLFGYTKKELLGQELNKLIPSGYSKGHNQHTSNFMNSPSNKKMEGKEELYGLQKNGKEFPIYISLSPLISLKGKITLAVIREVTKQKKDKQTLKNTMVDFKDIFESSVDETILVEPITMKIIKVNETVCFDTGYSKTELIGKKLSKILPVKDLEKKIYRIMTETGKKTKFFQANKRKKGGTIYPIEINLKAINYRGENVVMAIVRNITKRNLVDKKNARFSQIFEESLNEIFLFDSKSLKFVQVNNAAQKNIGYSMKELYKMTPIDIKPEFSKELFIKKISSLINGKQRELVFETIHERKDKSLYDVEVHLQKMEHGKESLFAAMILDISERKKTERQNAVINAISNKLSSNICINDFCQFVFSEIQQIRPFPNMYISNYDNINDEVSIFFQTKDYEMIESLPESRKSGNGLSEYVIKTKEGLLLNDKGLSSFHKKNNLKTYGTKAKSWVGVPLMSENKVVGVLAAQYFKEAIVYNESDLKFLSFIGTQIGALVDRDRVEKEIKQFEKYFSVSMDLLCIAGIDGYFKKINPKFSEILGYSEKELFSKSFVEFIHPDDKQATHQEIEKLSNGVKSINFMNRYRCKNGEYRWFLWSSTPDPKSGLIYAAAKDITKQKKSEEILAALTNIQDTFIEEASIGETFEKMLNVLLRVTQSEYGVIGEVSYDVNNKFSIRTLAITNILSDTDKSDFHERNVPNVLGFNNLKTLFGLIMTSGKPMISNDPSNDPRIEELHSVQPSIDGFMGLPFYKNKEIVGMIGIANKPNGYNNSDIDSLAPFLSTCSTLLKAHQNAVKKQIAEKEVTKLADIVSYSSDAIISTDQNGMVVSWNLAAENLLGYSKEEILGTSISILGPESLKKTHDKIITQVQNGKYVKSYDTQQLKKGNIIIHVNMSIFPLIDEDGEVKGISSILRDISEQREAQKVKEEFTKNLEIMVSERTIDLERVQKELKLSLLKEQELGDLKSKFVSTASHQFRTPLTVIKTNMGILEVQQKHMTDQFKPHFEKINKRIVGQISRMTNLMDQVLILGKINEDIVKPILEPTDLVELCKSISKTYDKIQLDGREIKLAVNGRPETIMLDTKLMQEALSNLISNALKYSINKPSPLVTIKFNKNDVQISIKDEGMGIPEGDLIHIFEPFYRASNVADLSGTGLGTVITKEYIELNGGTITVKSELNKGSEFIIKFKI